MLIKFCRGRESCIHVDCTKMPNVSKNSWYKRKKLLLVIAIPWILLLFLVLTHQIWLTKLASYLNFKTTISPSDVIIVLSGCTERFKHSVRLYKQGYAGNIMITASNEPLELANVHLDWEWIIRDAARQEGIPEAALLIVEDITSTYDEACFTRKIMLEKGFKSAIVVSSPYHMRRVRMIFEKVYKRSGISLYYSPVEESWFQVEKWWTREGELVAVVNEYIKLVFYWLKY